MPRPGSLAYKCRRCGSVFHPVHTPDGPTSLNAALFGLAIPSKWFGPRPTAIDVHRCSETIDGVGDLVGVTYD